MNLSLYNDSFFKWHYDFVHLMSVDTGRAFAKQYQFNSIVDYGCGIGSYLQGCLEEGVKVKGYEISTDAYKYTHNELFQFVEYKDFLDIKPERYEVAMCLDVAGRIDPEDSENMVDVITDSSDFIVFSAAPPGQEGTGHINCQPREYWIGLFEKRGFKMTRNFLESWINAPDYVLKNLMIFEK